MHLRDAFKYKIDTRLARAIRKYGEESFTLEILSSASSPEELNKLETLWIVVLNSINPEFGYNMTFGGDSRTPDEETRRKIGDSNRGQKRGPEALANLSRCKQGSKHPMFGKHHSLITRNQMAKSHSGVPKGTPSEETKASISRSCQGRIPWNKGKSDARYNATPKAEAEAIGRDNFEAE
jgi:group I intron endonuclease